jgi:hypothetical protein
MLTDEMKAERVRISQELLQRFENEGDGFLYRRITGDKTWVHYYNPEEKRQSMEYWHKESPQLKKFKTQASAGKVMLTAFWDVNGAFLANFMERGTTINSERYIESLNRLKKRFKRVWNENHAILQNNNATPHTSART